MSKIIRQKLGRSIPQNAMGSWPLMETLHRWRHFENMSTSDCVYNQAILRLFTRSSVDISNG